MKFDIWSLCDYRLPLSAEEFGYRAKLAMNSIVSHQAQSVCEDVLTLLVRVQMFCPIDIRVMMPRVRMGMRNVMHLHRRERRSHNPASSNGLSG